MKRFTSFVVVLGTCCVTVGQDAGQVEAAADAAIPFDHHMHIVSPRLNTMLKRLMDRDRSDEQYTDVGAILEVNRVERGLFLSAAYLWSGFGLGEQELAMVRAENDHLAAQVRVHADRSVGFCSVNPLRDYAEDEVRRCHEIGLVGLKLHLNHTKLDLRDRVQAEAVRDLLALAAELGMPVLIHVDSGADDFGREDLQRFVAMLESLPALELYIAHLGTNGGFDQSTRDALEVLDQAVVSGSLDHHTVLLELSGVVMSRENTRLQSVPAADLLELGVIMRRMGIERFVFGTDYSILDGPTYASQLRESLGLTDEEFDLLMSNGGPVLRALDDR